jgi:PPOX class probable F420-dependent enzyme
MTTSPILTPEADRYLREHRLAVLATGRRDGSPQVSHVLYDYDGSDVAVSVKTYTAKWHNALRRPRVAMLVHDGRAQLVLYGRAQGVAEDPERIELLARLARRKDPDTVVEDDFVARMDAERRTVLRIIPESAYLQH